MKKFNILFISIFFVNLTHAQNPLVKQWDYRFGGTGWDELHAFHQTADGGYILGGYTWSDSSGDKTQNAWSPLYFDYWIVKTDASGSKQWDKRFGGSDHDQLYALQQTADGGYIAGGKSFSQNDGDKTEPSWGDADYWIVKTNAAGNKQWDKRFGGSGYERLKSLQQTADGGYILGGWSSSGISGDKTQPSWGLEDYWVVKTDAAGNKQWDKRFGGSESDELYSLQQTADGGYILGGWSMSGITGDKTEPSRGLQDYWIIKTDASGIIQWNKRFGGTGDERPCILQQTADGGYILGGYSNSGISGDKTQDTIGGFDYWIVKTDLLGNKQWDKDFGGIADEEDFETISQAADGGYLLAGTSYSSLSGDKTEANLGYEQSWILKTDSSGNKQWDKTLHTNTGTGDDEAGFAIQSADGCYVMANYTFAGIGGDKTQPSWGPGSADYWIVKFCDSTSTAGIIAAGNLYPISISPNPSPGNFTITFTNTIDRGEVQIFNAYGAKVFSQNIYNTSNTEIHLSNIPGGIYFVKVWDGEKYFSNKINIL